MKTLGGNGADPDGAVRYRQDVRSGGRIDITPQLIERPI